MLDTTVRVFDQFYNTDLIINSNEYDVVYSYFKEYMPSAAVAKSFTETLFRISNLTNVNALDLLATFESGDKMKVVLTMAFYLNSVSNKTVLFGLSNLLAPNNLVQRNIVQ